MAKAKTIFYCTECGSETPKWAGKCMACGAWNTIVEQEAAPKARSGRSSGAGRAFHSVKAAALTDIDTTEEIRFGTGMGELDRVLGGGAVKGSLVLVGGAPGVGKSTLMLQICDSLCRFAKVLYVSGEESMRQVKLRANRLGVDGNNVLLTAATDAEEIYETILAEKPDVVVVDSIQTISLSAITSSAGSVTQVRECTQLLINACKGNEIPLFIVGHVNKDGGIAGPKVLEHMVDCVLTFEGERQMAYRILRATKNRFGNTSELGIYEMCQRGLREVTNPSEMLLSRQDEESLSGCAIGVTLEGIRPFLIEAQALVSTAAYGTPQRSVTGFDSKRMNMLLAVLEKRVGFKLAQKDVFLNIAGGLRVNDPALDLGVICAILSSNVDMAVPKGWCMAGEVGLTGEIRPVTRIEQRISEAAKLGMTDILVAAGNLKGIDRETAGITIHEVGKVEDAFRCVFG